MKVTFYDIFRYLRQVLDGEHQSELTLFVAAFVLQRLQNYSERFPECMSYALNLDVDCIDFYTVRWFILSYINDKCGKFAPDTLMISINFIRALLYSQFGTDSYVENFDDRTDEH